MALHRFRLDDLPATPWRNGGGTTREVVSLPLGAGIDSFDWRVSVATIAADGPFSEFLGIERTIMLLDGDGVHLRSTDPSHAVDHVLAEPLVPFGFSGDAPLECTLLGGESTDVNLMVRGGRGSADLAVHRTDTTLVADAGLLLSVGDRAVAEADGTGQGLANGEGLWWDSPLSFDVRLGGLGASVVAVTWRPARR
jgi:environmental stress-induced protein Ves